MLFTPISHPEELRSLSGRLFILLSEPDQNSFLDELAKRQEPYSGAVFPALIAHGELKRNGALVAQLTDDCESVLISAIDNPRSEKLKQLMNSATIFCFVDAFSHKLESFLNDAYTSFQDGIRMIGGGAGKLTLKQEPVIFDNSGVYADAAVLVGIKDQIGLGVGHGWEKVEGPFLVTGASGRSLQSLDYEAARDFYSDRVQRLSGVDPRKGDFFQSAKSYPLGIVTEDEELVVRDPIALNGGSIALVGDIHEYAVTYLLYGDTASLLEAARSVSKMALCELGDRTPESVFVVDCISRSIFLDADYQKELDVIRDEIQLKAPMSGALTLGEIASKDDRFIRFHNKTCVVGIR